MSVFLRCQCVKGRGTIRPKGCPDTHTWQYKFKEAFGGPVMAKYGDRYATFKRVQQGDTGYSSKTLAERHEANLRKDMRLIKSGEQPVGPLRVQASMGDQAMKLSALLAAYTEWMKLNMKASTRPAATHACTVFTDFLGGDRFIHTLDRDDFERFKAHRETQPGRLGTTLSQNYINTQLAYVQGMFREAEIFCQGFTSPFTPVVMAGKRRCPIQGFDFKQQTKRAPTAAELADIISRLPDPWDTILDTIFQTSARIGEVLALKTGDIHLHADGEGGWFQRELKGGGTHKANLSASLAVKLLSRLKAPGNLGVWFFQNKRRPTTHITTQYATTRLRELLDAMGYDWMKSHRVRHMIIRDMLKRGVPEHDVALMTGWTSTKQIPEYAGDRTDATMQIGQDNATLMEQVMKLAPADAVKVKPPTWKQQQALKTKKTVLPFKKTGVA